MPRCSSTARGCCREGRCRETGFLEFHHVEPYATGGEATVANIQLRCHAHNEYEARLFFGDGVVSESRTAWGSELVPERVRHDVLKPSSQLTRGWAESRVTGNYGRRSSVPMSDGALTALRALTFKDFGQDQNAWRTWWSSNQRVPCSGHLARFTDTIMAQITRAEPWTMNAWMTQLEDVRAAASTWNAAGSDRRAKAIEAYTAPPVSPEAGPPEGGHYDPGRR